MPLIVTTQIDPDIVNQTSTNISHLLLRGRNDYKNHIIDPNSLTTPFPVPDYIKGDLTQFFNDTSPTFSKMGEEVFFRAQRNGLPFTPYYRMGFARLPVIFNNETGSFDIQPTKLLGAFFNSDLRWFNNLNVAGASYASGVCQAYKLQRSILDLIMSVNTTAHYTHFDYPFPAKTPVLNPANSVAFWSLNSPGVACSPMKTGLVSSQKMQLELLSASINNDFAQVVTQINNSYPINHVAQPSETLRLVMTRYQPHTTPIFNGMRLVFSCENPDFGYDRNEVESKVRKLRESAFNKFGRAYQLEQKL